MSDDSNFGSYWYDEIKINGHTYTGRVAYQRHGNGSMRYKNGKTLNGNWANNVFDNEYGAEIEYDEPHCVYTGSVVVDEEDDDVYRDGEGTLHFDYSTKYIHIIGKWDNDELIDDCDTEIKYKNGNIYVGEAINEDIDDFYRHGKGTLTFNKKSSGTRSCCSTCCKKNNEQQKILNNIFTTENIVHKIIGTWDTDGFDDNSLQEIKYTNGNIYVGEASICNCCNDISLDGNGTMTFNCSDSIIQSITGIWNEDGILIEVEKIVYNSEKIELRSELNHSIKDAGYLPITDENSALGKRFREIGQNFNERNGSLFNLKEKTGFSSTILDNLPEECAVMLRNLTKSSM